MSMAAIAPAPKPTTTASYSAFQAMVSAKVVSFAPSASDTAPTDASAAAPAVTDMPFRNALLLMFFMVFALL